MGVGEVESGGGGVKWCQVGVGEVESGGGG